MRAGCILILLAAFTAGSLSAQGFRITGVSTAQYIDARPLASDSVPISQALGTGTLRQTADGTIVSCTSAGSYCYFQRSGATLAAVPLIQDLEVSAWGLATGLRFYADLRGRAAAGDAASYWPRAGDAFDALAAYLELDRTRYRVRVGRQWMTSGLGLYNFDGGDLVVRPLTGVSLEGYGGWSLANGLDESYTSNAISAVEPFAPDEGAYILGAQLHVRPTPRFSASALYQREIRRDRAGLYSERVAADARLLVRGFTLDGALQADLASGDVNEGRLRVRLPSLAGLAPTLQVRHYQPFFELWTIWGAFSPVGFDEATATLDWAAMNGRLALALHGGRRRYGDTGTGVEFAPLRKEGWTAGGDLTLRPASGWTALGSYDADIGFGAASTNETVSLRRELGAVGYLGVTGLAFQNAYEFQVGEGRVWGGGVTAGVRLTDAARVDGNIYSYVHHDRGNAAVDWTQMRGQLQLSWSVGADPGMRRLKEVGP